MERIRVAAYVAVLCSTPVLAGTACSAPQIDAEHTAIEQPPAAMSTAGPPMGTYRQTWRRTIESPRTVRFVAGQLVAFDTTGIRAYDARTGDPTWSYREPGRTVDGWTITAGVVVVGTAGPVGERETGRHLIGLDGGTGRSLWENRELWSLSHDGDEGAVWGPTRTADGVVVATDSTAEKRTALGVDARTGDELWRLELEQARPSREQPDKADQEILPLVERDGDTNTVLGVAPRSGEVRWRRTLKSSELPAVSSVDGTTLIRGNGATAATADVVDAEGKVRATRLGDRACTSSCRMLNEGKRIVVIGGRGASAFSVADRRWSEPAGADGLDPRADYVEARGTTYGVDPAIGRKGSPMALNRIEPGKGRVIPTPLPIGASSLPKDATMNVVAVAGGRVFTLTEPEQGAERGAPSVLTAFESARTTGSDRVAGSAELGGLRSADWPNTCGVLRAIARRVKPGYYGENAEPQGDLVIGEARVRGVECLDSFLGTFEIVWVAGTEEEASAVLDGDHRRRLGADEWSGERFRVGRIIARVRPLDQAADARVEAIAQHLRTLQ